MKKPHRIRERILDEHALGVAGQQRLGRSVALIGQKDGGFIVAEILHKHLPQGPAGQGDGLFIDPGRAILARGHVQLNGPPGRTRQQHDFLQQFGGRRRKVMKGIFILSNCAKPSQVVSLESKTRWLGSRP